MMDNWEKQRRKDGERAVLIINELFQRTKHSGLVWERGCGAAAFMTHIRVPQSRAVKCVEININDNGFEITGDGAEYALMYDGVCLYEYYHNWKNDRAGHILFDLIKICEEQLEEKDKCKKEDVATELMDALDLSTGTSARNESGMMVIDMSKKGKADDSSD